MSFIELKVNVTTKGSKGHHIAEKGNTRINSDGNLEGKTIESAMDVCRGRWGAYCEHRGLRRGSLACTFKNSESVGDSVMETSDPKKDDILSNKLADGIKSSEGVALSDDSSSSFDDPPDCDGRAVSDMILYELAKEILPVSTVFSRNCRMLTAANLTAVET